MQDWVNVAHLVKTKNLKGRFVARAAAGLPFLLDEGNEVAFVPPQLDAPRTATVQEVRLLDDWSAEVVFSGVDGDTATALVGLYCLVPRSSIDDAVFEEAPGSWDGWTVIDERVGDIGCIAGLVDNPVQALLEVARPDGSTVLVPVVDDIIRNVDSDACAVIVDLPNGLLDL